MKFRAFMLLFTLSLLFSCNKENREDSKSSSEGVSKETIKNEVEAEIPSIDEVISYAEYLSEYTTGIISIKDEIEVVINHELPSYKGSKNVKIEDALVVKGIKGNYELKNENRIVFTPSSPLPYDNVIDCRINFNKLYDNVPEDIKEFDFTVRTKKIDFELISGDLVLNRGSNDGSYSYTGSVEFSDWVDNELVKKSLKAKLEGSDIEPIWNHKGNKHSFTFKDLKRSEKAKIIDINFTGKYIGINREEPQEVDILPIGLFTYQNHSVDRGSTKTITVNFTSPIKANQELSSIVSLEGDSRPRISVSGAQLKIYPKKVKKGSIKVKIKKSIKSVDNVLLNKDIELDVVIEQEYPEVKILGSQGIITGDKALLFPFEAVSLRAVDVRIIEIFENNVIQYMQDNKIAKGTKNLRKVAKPVYQGTLRLDKSKKDLMVWNRFHIDLKDYINVNPGSIYQVELSIRRSLSLYGDPESNSLIQDRMEDQKWAFKSAPQNNSSYWDYYDSYNYNNSWRDRKDPNKDAYYSDPKKVKRRTVFATNIGIIAKRSDIGSLRAFITDLNSGDFIKNATVTAYNYQQQVIASGKTDPEGSIILDVKDEVPFAIKVDKGNDVGYLRLDDASSLNISTFDTSGRRDQNGIKGYIYGERGVWRPGDKVYLHFILDDELDRIPLGHPIVLTVKNPKGSIIYRDVKNKTQTPIYPFVFETSSDAPTGNWLATVEIGTSRFKKPLMIESVKPNRLKIDLDFGVEELDVKSGEVKGDLKVNWLHGAPGKNLRADFSVSYKSSPTNFKTYNDFIFTDPGKKISARKTNIFNSSVDENGFALVNFTPNSKIDAPGKAKILFTGKVYEESGDFSIKSMTIPYSPYESYVGLRVPKGDASRDMLLTDVDHKIRVVTLDKDGEPVDRDSIKLELYKINWKWWWDQSAYSDVPNFVSTKGKSLVKSGTISTKDGEGEWILNVSYPSWGRYLLRVQDLNSGHSAARVVYIDWPGWAGRSTEGEGGVSRLFFETDKKEYNVGEDISISFPSSKGSKALVSIENGKDILETFWVETTDKKTTYTIKAKENMFPGAYIHVSLIQPKGSKKNDRPVRLYGIVPIKLNSPRRSLNPVITMKDTLKPNSNFIVDIKEKDGKEMYYTLSIVDDGLLDLTNFITPNAYTTFFVREALGVKTWDLYDSIVGDVIGNYGTQLAVGGGGGGDREDKKKEEVSRFKPVVKVLGPYKLEKGKNRVHQLTMPNYIGSVRTMVTAANKGQYGASEKTTPVRDPLMVLGTMPRVLGPKESVKLPVTLFVMDKNIKDVEVNIKTEGLLKVVGESKRVVKTPSNSNTLTYFDLESLDDLGEGKVIIEAKSGNHTSLYTVNLNIRPSNPLIVKSEAKKVPSKGSVKFNHGEWGYKGSREMFIELSTMPNIDLDKRLGYLIRYPHGCIEQTTSGVLPQLFLGKLKDVSSEDRVRIEENIKKGIERLTLFQTASGGLAYWPGGNSANEWGTTYGGHFLVEADKQGYDVPKGLMNNWVDYQKKLSREFNPKGGRSNLNQAYRLYTLALYGEPEIGAMNRLYDKTNLSKQTKWRLAAAYALTGNKDAAKKLVSGLDYNIAPYRATSSTFGSSLRDKAMILETTLLIGESNFNLANQIATELGSPKYLSTQTIAYSLMAISRMESENGIEAKIIADGKEIPVNIERGLYSEPIPYSSLVEIKNLQKGDIYASLISKGINRAGEEKASKSGLSVERTFILPSGTQYNKIPSGTNFKVKVKVKNLTSSLQEEIALSALLPGGWEIINNRIMGYSAEGESTYDFKDIRDDRVYYYFDLYSGEEKVFIIELNASYIGNYYMPGMSADSMYNLDTKGSIPGEWIEVVSSN